jgi:8-oxo-dGTP pyrophosphatase MutT (NUDIX family)
MAIVSHDSETPAHGQQVITVCAFIHYDFDGIKKLFVPRRAKTKKFLPGFFELPGGHVDFGESLEEGLKREVKEELNMTIHLGEPFAAFTYDNKIKGSHTVEVIYFAQFIEPIEKISINSADHEEYKWFSKSEIIAHKAEIIAQDSSIELNTEEDPEYLAMIRGFSLLAGDKIKVS